MLLILVGLFSFVGANIYVAEIGFLTSQNVYQINDRIELTGYVYLTNYTNNGSISNNHTPVANAELNLTIYNSSSGLGVSSFLLNTTSNGIFYSRNDYYSSGVLVTAPSTTGYYDLRINYTDPNNVSWWTENEILIVNNSVELLEVTTDKISYTPGEAISVYAEAVKEVGGSRIFLANVNINGSIQNSSKAGLQNFSCITGSDGRCTALITAPSTAGTYLIEVNSYKGFTSIVVGSFEPKILMKDDLGESLRYVFAPGEDASVVVSVPTSSVTETYTFVGTVRDVSGTIVENIVSTTLEYNNSYTNKYLWNLDATSFSAGRYNVEVNVTKTSGTTVGVRTSFEVRSWVLSVQKSELNSNFEYEYSVFPNKTVKMEIYPAYRANGSIISTINTSNSFNISIIDPFNNIYSRANATWNGTCSVEGCYQFSIVVPNKTGDYVLSVFVTYDADILSKFRTLYVINKTVSAQSTDISGTLKDLFGINEYVYLSLSGKNETNSFNFTNASVLRVTFMNGSVLNYSEVGKPDLVNLSNSVYEWAWNVSSQKLKLDPAGFGGLYNVDLVVDNNTAGTSGRFYINPYDVCMVAKNTPGSVLTGYYYTYQFKVGDTIYFELKITQAQNPVGRAAFENATNGSFGMGSGCVDYSSTKQVVNNATITIEEVKNIESGKVFAFNTTSSSCQSDDNSGGYTCTISPNGTWDGGSYGVKLKVLGSDGVTTDFGYGGFQARAFYIYAWSNTWSNRPSSNITLNVDMYEAGSNWWSSVGSGGLKGTVTLEKVEYMGREGEWVWPPVDYDYNVSKVNSTSITSGRGTMVLPANCTKNNAWASGSYRAVLKGTGDDGTSDYGYAWFNIRNWETYGSPVDCSSGSCTSVYNLNSKDNVSLYVTITNAGQWGVTGAYLGGNVSVRVSKIMDCRKWPCTDYNKSLYNASIITVNRSNGWYWGSNSNPNYTIYINNTQGTWGSGYWQVLLDVNGTETGFAWFNTIAFYAEVMPSNVNGSYKYGIKNSEAKYFQVRTMNAQKSGGYYYTGYSSGDYINTTIDDLSLWVWDPNTYKSRELKYRSDINISIVGGGTVINGSKIVNVTYLNGSNWGSGYYNGQLILKNSAGETGMAWLWFQVQPFRVSISLNDSSVNDDSCVYGTINVYEPDWSSTTYLNGSYNVTGVQENSWSGMNYQKTEYTNFTPTSNNSFVNFSGIKVCPNSGSWGGGSWGNYHYLNVKVVDSSGNSETGWMSFRAVPFSVSWSSVNGGTNVLRTNAITVPVNLSKASDGSSATGNLTRIYQWRWDSNFNGMEEYVFNVGSCWSNVSGTCNITGMKNVVIYPPTSGWKVGYNYLQASWKSASGNAVDDYSNIWFNGQEIYSGSWSNYNSSNMWQYYFSENVNLSIQLYVRDQNQNSVAVNVTNVEYAESSSNCWDEYCRVYRNADFRIGTNAINNGTMSGSSALITLVKGTSNWSRGYIYIRATVRAINGTGPSVVVTGGSVYVKDMTPPTVNLTSPVVGQNVTTSAFAMNWTTSEEAQCYGYMLNFNNFKNWYCTSYYNIYHGLNLTANYCNSSLFNGSSYYSESVSKDYWSYYNGSDWGWSSGATGFSTGGTTHSFMYNISHAKVNQDYGLQVYCYDNDWNTGYGWSVIRVNNTG